MLKIKINKSKLISLILTGSIAITMTSCGNTRSKHNTVEKAYFYQQLSSKANDNHINYAFVKEIDHNTIINTKDNGRTIIWNQNNAYAIGIPENSSYDQMNLLIYSINKQALEEQAIVNQIMDSTPNTIVLVCPTFGTTTGVIATSLKIINSLNTTNFKKTICAGFSAGGNIAYDYGSYILENYQEQFGIPDVLLVDSNSTDSNYSTKLARELDLLAESGSNVICYTSIDNITADGEIYSLIDRGIPLLTIQPIFAGVPQNKDHYMHCLATINSNVFNYVFGQTDTIITNYDDKAPNAYYIGYYDYATNTVIKTKMIPQEHSKQRILSKEEWYI